MTRHYYNENDKFNVDWLRELIAAGHLPAGDVDERDIRDVRPNDLIGYAQCHFFAGIGGWPLALRLAGWPEDRAVWTGSCPCQPFSVAGRQKGDGDDRHLWPTWYELILVRRPPVIFGEQVANAVAHGWLDLVLDDLEGVGYSCGAAILPACCVGAPHVRQRLWFMADRPRGGRSKERPDEGRVPTGDRQEGRTAGPKPSRLPSDVADAEGGRRGQSRPPAGGPVQQGNGPTDDGLVGHADQPGPQGRLVVWDGTDQRPLGASGMAGFWADAEWVPCADGRRRPAQPGAFPLAHGVPSRVGRLRAYGNAVVPPLAATLVLAYLDARRNLPQMS